MSLLNPKSIAVIGASAEEKKVGHYVLQNLITQGFKGELYPVNPKGGEILGKKAFTSVAEIPGNIDLAVVVTPAKTVNALADECGKKGVKTLVVISAGFGETGTDEGHAMERELVATAKKHSMDLVGPNCLGVIRPSIGMNASFGENLQQSGSVALLSQSGAMAVALMDAAAGLPTEAPGSAKVGLHVGFSLVVSMGNKAAMDECDFLELCRNDPETHVIGMYLESITDGKKFMEIASEVAAEKPIVLIKAGVSEHGKKAVSSHTGALAGSDAAIDAACAQTGIRRAHDTEEFMDMIRALSMQPPLLSSQIAIITNAGGPGILATDASEREKLVLPSLLPKVENVLKAALPPAASAHNPIDVLGDAGVERYAAALEACGEDPNIDGVAVVLTPQVMTPETEIANAIIAARAARPLMPIVTSFMGQKNIAEAERLLHAAGIPNYPTPERAVRALAALRVNNKEPGLRNSDKGKDPMSYSPIPKSSIDLPKGLLNEEATSQLFSAYDLPLPSGSVAKTADEAVALSESIGFPVVAKISSPQILHKTDIGCVRVNLKTASEVKSAFEEIMKNAKKHQPKADLQGVFIQQFLPAGHEFIVGAIKDPNFGHMVMVGLGGIYTELFRDTCFRIAPIDEKTAYEMLQELKSWKLLLGLRGKKQSDIDSLAKIIAKVSHLVSDYPQISELDLNPVLVWEDRVTIADAKVVIEN